MLSLVPYVLIYVKWMQQVFVGEPELVYMSYYRVNSDRSCNISTIVAIPYEYIQSIDYIRKAVTDMTF